MIAARRAAPALSLLVQCAIVAAASVLLYTGFAKWADPDAFAAVLAEHAVIPSAALGPATYAVPSAEILIGLLACLWAFSPATAARASGAVSLVFAAFAVYALMVLQNPPGQPTGCGCGFSSAPIEDWRPIVLRNASVASGFAVAAFGFATRVTQNPSSRPACRDARA